MLIDSQGLIVIGIVVSSVIQRNNRVCFIWLLPLNSEFGSTLE